MDYPWPASGKPRRTPGYRGTGQPGAGATSSQVRVGTTPTAPELPKLRALSLPSRADHSAVRLLLSFRGHRVGGDPMLKEGPSCFGNRVSLSNSDAFNAQ